MKIIKARSGRFFLMALLLLAGSSLLLSCSPAENTGPDTTSAVPEFTGGPRLHFDQVFIDLGTATPEQAVSAEFHFRNVGDAPLELAPIEKESLEGC